jgi:hypothetical protein
VSSIRRIVIMAEMHGRDLTRRHIALGLLLALPLSFYLSSAGKGQDSIVAGGVGLAFAVSGATLFSVLSSQEVDQRLVLAGYLPRELLLGRLAFLGPLGVAIAAAFSGLMIAVSGSDRPWLTFLGVALVALLSIPFGLAIGVVVQRELEGTLVLIGVIGLQLAAGPDAAIAPFLPFDGPRRVIAASLGGGGAIAVPVIVTCVYGLALFTLARIVVTRRLAVGHEPADADGVPDDVPASGVVIPIATAPRSDHTPPAPRRRPSPPVRHRDGPSR